MIIVIHVPYMCCTCEIIFQQIEETALLCPSQHTPSLSDMFLCPARTPSKLLKWIPHASRDQGATGLYFIFGSSTTTTHHGSTFSVLVLVLFMFLPRVPTMCPWLHWSRLKWTPLTVCEPARPKMPKTQHT